MYFVFLDYVSELLELTIKYGLSSVLLILLLVVFLKRSKGGDDK